MESIIERRELFDVRARCPAAQRTRERELSGGVVASVALDTHITNVLTPERTDDRGQLGTEDSSSDHACRTKNPAHCRSCQSALDVSPGYCLNLIGHPGDRSADHLQIFWLEC